MIVLFEKMKKEGYSDFEIGFVEGWLQRGPMNQRAAIVLNNGEPIWVCESVAEAVEHLRPGSWLKELTEECIEEFEKRGWTKNGKKN